jgi:hypothetical protein
LTSPHRAPIFSSAYPAAFAPKHNRQSPVWSEPDVAAAIFFGIIGPESHAKVAIASRRQYRFSRTGRRSSGRPRLMAGWHNPAIRG